MTQQIKAPPPEHDGPETPGDIPRSRHLVLMKPLGAGVWLADTDGQIVDARRAPSDTDTRVPAEPGNRAALAALTSMQVRELARVIDVADEEDGASWLLSEHIDGITLRRLLAFVNLTPAQAAFIAVRILDGVLALHAAGFGHGHLTSSNVVIDENGEPHLTDWAPVSLAEGELSEQLRERDHESARILVADLARNTSRPAVWKHPRAESIRTCLEHCGNGGSRAGIDAMADLLLAALGTSLAPEAVDNGIASPSTELARLVRALNRSDPGSNHHDALPGLASSPDVAERISWHRPKRVAMTKLSLSRLPSAGSPGRRSRWLLPALAIAAVLIGVAVAGVAYKGDSGSLLDRLLHRNTVTAGGAATGKQTPGAKAPGLAGSIASHGSNAATGEPRAVPELAPPSAGPISGVEMRALSSCGAASTCSVRTTVRFAPAYGGEQVAWRVVGYDRCTGRTTALAHGNVTGAPGTYVFDSATLTLPRSRSYAVIALVDAPARVASAPMLVPTSGGRCQ